MPGGVLAHGGRKPHISSMPKREPRRAGGIETTLRQTDGSAATGNARTCEHAGCREPGEFRAPKSPERMREHYWFCLDHVREYNKAWNFCAGLSDQEIEAMIRADVVGWRPTWPLGHLGGRTARAHFDRMRDSFGLFADESEAETRARAAARERVRRRKAAETGGQERDALSVMALASPLTPARLKARYKELVKLHHPDANGGDKGAEERLKLINQAYATLKQRLGV
jgi:hypothetical protein